MVEAVAADGPHPSAPRSRWRERLNRRPQTLDTEVGTPDPVAVMDQVVRFCRSRMGFDQLPPDPCRPGLDGHLEVGQLVADRAGWSFVLLPRQ